MKKKIISVLISILLVSTPILVSGNNYYENDKLFKELVEYGLAIENEDGTYQISQENIKTIPKTRTATRGNVTLKQGEMFLLDSQTGSLGEVFILV